MKNKVRLIRVMAVEYIPNPENYEVGMTIEEMAQVDADAEDRDLTFDDILLYDNVMWQVLDDNNNVISTGESALNLYNGEQ